MYFINRSSLSLPTLAGSAAEQILSAIVFGGTNDEDMAVLQSSVWLN
jgi:hypothetical protein